MTCFRKKSSNFYTCQCKGCRGSPNFIFWNYSSRLWSRWWRWQSVYQRYLIYACQIEPQPSFFNFWNINANALYYCWGFEIIHYWRQREDADSCWTWSPSANGRTAEKSNKKRKWVVILRKDLADSLHRRSKINSK